MLVVTGRAYRHEWRLPSGAREVRDYTVGEAIDEGTFKPAAIANMKRAGRLTLASGGAHGPLVPIPVAAIDQRPDLCECGHFHGNHRTGGGCIRCGCDKPGGFEGEAVAMERAPEAGREFDPRTAPVLEHITHVEPLPEPLVFHEVPIEKPVTVKAANPNLKRGRR